MAITILTLLGTRPEIIKLAPVLRALEARPMEVRSITINSGQHGDLLSPLAQSFGIELHHDLRVMDEARTPLQVVERVLDGLQPLLQQYQPDLVLVQGDTATALAGAMAGFYAGIPVGHVEAGLRSGDMQSPFPEEMHRRLISQMATLHFAPTQRNVDTLLAEGVVAEAITLTGNPVVDAVTTLARETPPSVRLRGVLDAIEGYRTIMFTSHRRESFGAVLEANLHVMRRFVEAHADIALVFPVHPNPHVTKAAEEVLRDVPRVHLLPPLEYADFICLLEHAWLIVSDSGGVQEEAPSLGKPLLVLRENTERPEVIESGLARLVGGAPERLATMLDEAYGDAAWITHVEQVANPFGSGDSGYRIVDAIAAYFSETPDVRARV